MAMSKADVCRAFRVVMAADYADVPPAEEISHVFSASFLSSMAKLVDEEKRGSWHLLSRRCRRALIVAAVLAAVLLLTACSPKLREAVTEFVVSVYERVVGYEAKNGYREELETIYVLDPVPEGFAFVSQTQHSAYYVQTFYQDSYGTMLLLGQRAFDQVSGMVDNECGEVLTVGEGNNKVLVYCAEMMTTANWSYDDYFMHLSYFGPMDSEQVLALVASLSPMETN